MVTLGEGYRALGAGMSSSYRSRAKELKDLQRQQLLMAALTPVAQGVGQFATDLISAPFKDAPQQFMNTEEGRRLKTIKAARRADQDRVAARRKLITDSGLDDESFIRQEVATNVDAQMEADLGDEFTNNTYLFAKERAARINSNTSARLSAWQDAQKKVATVYTDDEWRDIISEYNPEPANLGQGLWQGGKRLLGFGKSREESRRDAFDEILTYFELDPANYSTPESTKKTLNEIRSGIVQGVRPFNPQEIDQQLQGDFKNNMAFQSVLTRRERAKAEYKYFSENHSDLFLNAYDEAGQDVQKALRIVDKTLAKNAELLDPTEASNVASFVRDYSGDEISAEVQIKLRDSFYRSMYPETAFEDLSDKQKADYATTAKARMESTIATAYSYGTRAAARQIEELKKSNSTMYAEKFAGTATADTNKTQLVLNNMHNLLENHLAEIEIVTSERMFSADETMSIFSGQLSIPKEGLPFEERTTVVAEPAGGATATDPNATAVPVAAPTDKETFELPRGEAIVAQYEAGDTAQAFKTIRSTIKQDIKNRKFSSAEEAVSYGLQTSQDIADSFGLPNPLTTGTGRPAVKNSVFAQDGDTQEFSIEGGSKSLLGRDVDVRDATYTLSLDGGQVNVSVSQPGERSKRPLTLEEIPEGNIKNHLTYLKMTYQGNIEELQSLGVDEPQSRSLSGLNGRALELKKINNELLGAIDLPGLGDRGDVISFLTATPYNEPEKSESLLSDPAEEAPAVSDFEAPDASTVEQVAAEVSKLFNDGKAATALLRETAIQESNMGQTTGTYDMVDDPKFGRGSFGVGQVDERNFEDTMSRLRGDKGQPRNLVKYVQRFKDELGIDLTEVEYEDLADPKLGLIFTRLHYLKNPDPVPPTVQGRSKYWKKFYNTSAGAGTAAEYLANQEAYADIYGDD